ncbi:MAG: hypothetical protein ACI4M3_09010 [Acutalibacteraceae bacterium]
MQYWKYGFFSIVKKPLFNILIILELAAILVVGNMAISVYNYRAVAYKPYADVLEHDGYIFLPKYNPLIGSTNGGYDEKALLDKFYKSLRGDLTISETYSHILHDSSLEYSQDYQSIYALDSNIMSKMCLPLESGRWASNEKDADGYVEAVVTSGTGYKLGDILLTQYNFDIKVVGIIGPDSYMPAISITSGEDDIRYMYDITEEFTDKVFVSCSADKVLHDPCYRTRSIVYIYYNTEPSAEDRSYNENQLMKYAVNSTYITTAEMKSKTMNYLNEQGQKMLPILICVFAVVLVELICSVAMHTKEQLRNYGIYFLCGCRWKGSLKISAAYSAIILLGGGIVGTIAYLLFQSTEYAALFGQSIEWNNLYLTLAIIAVMLILSLVIPFFQVRSTTPVETIKENK